MNSNNQRDAYLLACSVENLSRKLAEDIQKNFTNEELDLLLQEYYKNISRARDLVATLGKSLSNTNGSEKNPIGFIYPSSNTTKNTIGF